MKLLSLCEDLNLEIHIKFYAFISGSYEQTETFIFTFSLKQNSILVVTTQLFFVKRCMHTLSNRIYLLAIILLIIH